MQAQHFITDRWFHFNRLESDSNFVLFIHEVTEENLEKLATIAHQYIEETIHCYNYGIVEEIG